MHSRPFSSPTLTEDFTQQTPYGPTVTLLPSDNTPTSVAPEHSWLSPSWVPTLFLQLIRSCLSCHPIWCRLYELGLPQALLQDQYPYQLFIIGLKTVGLQPMLAFHTIYFLGTKHQKPPCNHPKLLKKNQDDQIHA
jgi:hypothetical protein